MHSILASRRPFSAARCLLAGFSLSALPLVSLSAVAAAPAPVISTISAVTAYSDRAVVTRAAHLDSLPVGEQELTFAGLPSALMDESLQVTARGAAQATILDVNARNTFVAATPNPQAQDLENQIKAKDNQLREKADSLAILAQQRDYIIKIQNATTTPVGGTNAAPVTRPGVDDWLKLLAFTEKNLGDIATGIQAVEKERDRLQDDRIALQQQLNLLGVGSSARVRNVKTVTVRLAVTAPGALDLALIYGVRGASWTPAYDARLHAAGDKPAVELAYFGVVRQSTGEDWKNVALTLSTARPALGGAAPALAQWVVDEARPMPVMVAAPAAPGFGGGARGAQPPQGQSFLAGGAALRSADTNAAMEDASAFSLASVEQGATSASYKIPAAATILSDNSPQRVGIANASLAATLQFNSTPRTLEAAFLTAKAANSSEFPFLAGTMNTFLDDNFIATSSLKTVMPGEKFELALGVDEGIAVKRRLVNRLTEQVGFTSKTTRVTYEFLLTLTNNKKTRAHVEFKEVLPLSRNEKIVVKLLTPDEREVGTLAKPGKEVTLEEDNKLVWRLDLDAGKKREITLKFYVEHPGDVTVTGLQ